MLRLHGLGDGCGFHMARRGGPPALLWAAWVGRKRPNRACFSDFLFLMQGERKMKKMDDAIFQKIFAVKGVKKCGFLDDFHEKKTCVFHRKGV